MTSRRNELKVSLVGNTVVTAAPSWCLGLPSQSCCSKNMAVILSRPHDQLFLFPECSQLIMCCAVLCLVTQSCPTLCDAMDCSWSDSSVHGDSPGKNTGGSCHALLQAWDLPNSGIEPRSPTLQADSLLFEPPGKPQLIIECAESYIQLKEG